MTKQAKILSSTFKTEWNNPKGGLIYYHDVVLEGEGDKAWNIGSQTKNPDFLAVGQTLAFEVVDEVKRKIKRAKVENFSAGGGGGFKSFERDPLIQELILLQSCTDRAVSFMQYVVAENRTKENVIALASWFRDRILEKAKENVKTST